jgi:hypothetical protein
LIDAVGFLLVLVDLKGQSFEYPIGEEVKVDENDREYEATHLKKALRRQIRVLHPIFKQESHLNSPHITYCSRLKMIERLST